MPVNSFDDHPLSWTPDRSSLSEGPVYLALAAALEGDIHSGALHPGAKLPPQRELADYLDIDFTTVTRAYGVCREKGLIYGVTGRGTFVAAPFQAYARNLSGIVVIGEYLENSPSYPFSSMLFSVDTGGVPLHCVSSAKAQHLAESLFVPGQAVLWMTPAVSEVSRSATGLAFHPR